MAVWNGGGGKAASADVKRYFPPVIHVRTQGQPHFAGRPASTCGAQRRYPAIPRAAVRGDLYSNGSLLRDTLSGRDPDIVDAF